MFGRLEIWVDWELQLLASWIHGSTWAAPHPVISQAQLAREETFAVDAQLIIPSLLPILKSAASALQLQLNVDVPPDRLHHPALRISVDEICHLVLVGPGPFTLSIHHLQGTMEVNGKKQSSFRCEHEGGGWKVVACGMGMVPSCPSMGGIAPTAMAKNAFHPILQAPCTLNQPIILKNP